MKSISHGCISLLLLFGFAVCSNPQLTAAEQPATIPKVAALKVAAIVTVYKHNSHADMFLTRLLEGYNLDGTGGYPKLKLVSLYTDQVPKDDMGREMSKKHGFPIYQTVTEALTLGTGKLAVDGVLLIAEHGDYPKSESGSTMYPKRRLFAELFKVFESSGRVVPVFSDKHLSDNWTDADWIYNKTRKLKIPFMAGSSLPIMWRNPQIDLKRGSQISEITGVSYGALDSYGYHGLEMIQSLAERRAGGETGIKWVRTYSGDDVWRAGSEGVYDTELLNTVLAGLKFRKIPEGKTIKQLVREPVLFSIQYRDGLKANLFTLNGAVAEWNVAWKTAGGTVKQTHFAHQEGRPYAHFTHLLKGVEQMMHTGQPTWPVERTLLTSGVLDAALLSKHQGGKRILTPLMDIKYQSNWNWAQPPPMAQSID